ncbi:hypothetical protein MPDQ_002457 [Monascus purpureus]|uniref:Uncharacterized protein n=1 Tax=Monascus purpureus TaxID=5098 RepID=A0A507QPG6_MONPU|nr:hypothetical protein MPDQ_002457 [Monascus purpureus]
MDDDSTIQFLAARSRKVRPYPTARLNNKGGGARSHRQLSDSDYSNSQPSWRERGETSSSSRRPNPHSDPHLSLPPLPPRYVGDGFDFRRPIMSRPHQMQEEVIDLTNEPDSPPRRTRHHDPQHSGATTPHRARPPRFGRNIMDDVVVDLEEETQAPINLSSSPEVQYMGGPRSPEVEFVRSTVRPAPLPRRPPTFISHTDILNMLRLRVPILPDREATIRQEVARRARNLPHRPPQEVETLWIDGPRSDLDLAVDLTFEFPDITPGFDSTRRPPSYKPPSPAPEGFTRNARDNDVVVCPNCDAELGVGDEIKKQIWVAKQCGHVRIVPVKVPAGWLTQLRSTAVNVPQIVH